MSGSLKDGSNVLPREQCKLDGWWDAQMRWAGTEIFQGKFLSWIPLQRPPKVPCGIQEGYQQPGDQSLFHPTLHMAGFNVTQRQTVSLINQVSKCRMTVLPHNFNICVWTEKWNLIFDKTVGPIWLLDQAMRIGDQVDYTLLIFPSTHLKRLVQYFYRDILDIS